MYMAALNLTPPAFGVSDPIAHAKRMPPTKIRHNTTKTLTQEDAQDLISTRALTEKPELVRFDSADYYRGKQHKSSNLEKSPNLRRQLSKEGLKLLKYSL